MYNLIQAVSLEQVVMPGDIETVTEHPGLVTLLVLHGVCHVAIGTKPSGVIRRSMA